MLSDETFQVSDMFLTGLASHKRMKYFSHVVILSLFLACVCLFHKLSIVGSREEDEYHYVALSNVTDQDTLGVLGWSAFSSNILTHQPVSIGSLKILSDTLSLVYLEG